MNRLIAIACLASALIGAGAAQAMPLAPLAPAPGADVIEVAGGCGPGCPLWRMPAQLRQPGGACLPARLVPRPLRPLPRQRDLSFDHENVLHHLRGGSKGPPFFCRNMIQKVSRRFPERSCSNKEMRPGSNAIRSDHDPAFEDHPGERQDPYAVLVMRRAVVVAFRRPVATRLAVDMIRFRACQSKSARPEKAAKRASSLATPALRKLARLKASD